MKKLMMTLMAVMIAIAANAQYNTNYYNQYGSSIGSSTTRSNYGSMKTAVRANCQLYPMPRQTVKTKNALMPMPGARPKGFLA